MFDGYIRRLKTGGELAYDYIGDWDELMEDAKPEIAEMVEKLRAKI
jgi:hypothetical protein